MTKEEKAKYDKEWREKNIERIKEYKRRYYQKNIDKCRTSAKNRRKHNPEYTKTYISKNKDHLREYARKWYYKNPNRARERNWKISGIDMANWSYEKYCKMFDSQCGKCLGCGCDLVLTKTEASDKFMVAHVDHDHNTGRVRGLLCGACNDICGKAKDNPKILMSLVSYLQDKWT